MSKSKIYKSFVKIDNVIMGVQEAVMTNELPAGMYEVQYNAQMGAVAYLPMTSKHDKIVNMNNGEFAHVLKDIKQFLTAETRQAFHDMGFLYKNSFLLHGKPGVGKTIIVNMLAQHIIAAGGVVLFNPDPRALPICYAMIEQVKPGTLVMVIFEELEEHLDDHEHELLSILDGETQKDNVVYVATTNFIGRIPPRIRRPGRFATVIEVHVPSREMREQYLREKLSDETLLSEILKATDGFTIDEVREVVRAHVCLKHDLKSVIKRIKEIQKMNDTDDTYRQDRDDEQTQFAQALANFVGGGRKMIEKRR